MKKLYLVCGVPGAGKTTWIKARVEEHFSKGEDAVWLSRDVTRFSLLKDDEDYFAREDEVIETWIGNINKATKLGISNVYVDATHLSEKARNAVLDKLYLKDYQICPVNFLISLKTCLEQNEKRKGIGRTYVPRSVIRRMYYQFKPAEYGEKYSYPEIINIKEGEKDV